MIVQELGKMSCDAMVAAGWDIEDERKFWIRMEVGRCMHHSAKHSCTQVITNQLRGFELPHTQTCSG